MLGKTDPQENFFDAYIKDNFLPEEHELLEIKEKVDFSFIQLNHQENSPLLNFN